MIFASLAFVKTRRQLAIEVLVLRHQLGVIRRSVKRPRLSDADRGLWVLLSRNWARWSDVLVMVKPDTVIKWHRAGFRRYWAWRSRPKAGRPSIDPKVRALIKRMATANLWGARASTVSCSSWASGFPKPLSPSTCRIEASHHRRRGGPFWTNHLPDLVSVDFFWFC
jgi:hypothetical protein